MNILILNGSPRPSGVTSAMIEAFIDGAKGNGHEINVIPVGRKRIAGCMACEYCHTKGEGHCVQQDDMQEVYSALEKAEMIIPKRDSVESRNEVFSALSFCCPKNLKLSQ